MIVISAGAHTRSYRESQGHWRQLPKEGSKVVDGMFRRP